MSQWRKLVLHELNLNGTKLINPDNVQDARSAAQDRKKYSNEIKTFMKKQQEELNSLGVNEQNENTEQFLNRLKVTFPASLEKSAKELDKKLTDLKKLCPYGDVRVNGAFDKGIITLAYEVEDDYQDLKKDYLAMNNEINRIFAKLLFMKTNGIKDEYFKKDFDTEIDQRIDAINTKQGDEDYKTNVKNTTDELLDTSKLDWMDDLSTFEILLQQPENEVLRKNWKAFLDACQYDSRDPYETTSGDLINIGNKLKNYIDRYGEEPIVLPNPDNTYHFKNRLEDLGISTISRKDMF